MRTPLEQHRRVGSLLRPPMRTLPLKPVDGLRELAPEFLWMDALVSAYAMRRHLALMDAVLGALRGVDHTRKGIRLGLVSDFGVPSEAITAMRKSLPRRTRELAFPHGFREAMAAYEAFPGEYLIRDLALDPSTDGDAWLRAAIRRVADRHSTHGAYLNALAFRNAISSGKIHIEKSMHEALTPAVRAYPGGSELQRQMFESTARAQVNVMYGMDMETLRLRWPADFWRANRRVACRPDLVP